MVLDTLLGLVFGGFSSTSSTAGCMLTHVARSPEARAAVAAEIATWPEAERAPRGPLDFDRLTLSPALDSIVAETLRLTPPVLGFFRKAEEDIVLDGRVVEKGSRMLWGFDPANMSEAGGFEQPRSFCPMRFVAAAGGAPPPPKPPNFGAGVHSCMGIDIAKLELKARSEQQNNQRGAHLYSMYATSSSSLPPTSGSSRQLPPPPARVSGARRCSW